MMDIQKEKFNAHIMETYGEHVVWNGDKPTDIRYADLWTTWQQAQKVAVPEGFVLVEKEPYAYLIKHKLWQKDSDPEIYLATDFLGDDGVEKDKLTVCKPLYLGDDEAQEQVG